MLKVGSGKNQREGISEVDEKVSMVRGLERQYRSRVLALHDQVWDNLQHLIQSSEHYQE